MIRPAPCEPVNVTHGANLMSVSYRRLKHLALSLLAVAWPLAAGQGALPEAASEALRAGQLAAAEAVATYEAHYPDQPLWREAIAQGERARSLAPGRLEPLRFLAQVYGITGWTSRTWEAWQEYLELGGTLDARARADAARAALVLGYQAFTAGAMERARELLEASYDLVPDDLTTVTYLGQARLQTGDVEGAIPLLEVAAETYPQLRPTLQRATLGAEHGLGAADAFLAAERQFAQDNMAGALSLYVAAMQSDPGFVDAIKGAAQANAALGRADEARRLWERALSVDPDDAEVRAVLARLDAAAQAAEVAAQAAQEAQAAAEAEAEAQAAAEAEAPPVVLAPPGGQPPAAEPAGPVAEAPPGPGVGARPDGADQPPAAEPPGGEEAEQPAAEPPVVEQPEEEPPVAEEPPAQEPPAAEPPAEEPPVAEPPAEEPPVAEPAPEEPDEEPGGDAVAALPPEPEPRPEPEPQAAAGQALALVDATISPRPVEQGGEGAFTFLEAPAAAVGDLRAYGRGTLHVQVELLDKPTDEPVLVQLCLVPDDLITVRPACSEPSALRLEDEGVVSVAQSVAGMEGAAAIDWSQGMAQVLVVLRDGAGRPLDARYAYDEQGRPLDVAAYYPMSLHVRAALVPEGGTFTGW